MCAGPVGMSTSNLASGLNVSLAAVAFAALTACSAGATNDGAQAGESDLVSDAATLTQRPDGKFDVVCKGGRHEIVTVADILADKVCEGAPLPVTCVKQCNARDINAEISGKLLAAT